MSSHIKAYLFIPLGEIRFEHRTLNTQTASWLCVDCENVGNSLLAVSTRIWIILFTSYLILHLQINIAFLQSTFEFYTVHLWAYFHLSFQREGFHLCPSLQLFSNINNKDSRSRGNAGVSEAEIESCFKTYRTCKTMGRCSGHVKRG